MNQRQHHEEARRRRMITRSMAQNRQIFFEAIRGSTVNYASATMRRSNLRQQPSAHEIDDPRMTLALQAGIVITMLGTLVLFRAPLTAALQSGLVSLFV